MKLFFLLFSFALSTTANASWEEDFAQLKDRPRSYEDTGAICEELARLKFEKIFNNSQYEVVVGIAYGDSRRTIGELDVVVFDRVQRNVLRVAEVKCWKDLDGGLKKAREQRMRFLTNIKSSKPIYFQSTSTDELYDTGQFKNVAAFTSLGQKGSKLAGYDDELDYELRELHRPRGEMIRCQDRGECVKPE